MKARLMQPGEIHSSALCDMPTCGNVVAKLNLAVAQSPAMSTSNSGEYLRILSP